MIEYFFNFLTSLIQRPDISDRIAISAGHLIHSLQRLVLAEQRWYRVQSTPKPSCERKKSHSPDVEPTSSANRPVDGQRSGRHKNGVNRQAGNIGGGQHGRSLVAKQLDGTARPVSDADWPTAGDAPMLQSTGHARPQYDVGTGFTMPSESAAGVSNWS